MKEELEIIVNEEQFLEDEEPMLEDATVKCEELERVVETLKKYKIFEITLILPILCALFALDLIEGLLLMLGTWWLGVDFGLSIF